MSLVLFVCAENRHRSVICEHRMRQMLSQKESELPMDIKVASAGFLQDTISFGISPSTYAIESMKRRGVDISKSRSKRLNETMVEKADLIVVFGDAQKEAVLSNYPTARGKVYILQELVGYDGYLINIDHPDGAAAFNSETRCFDHAYWFLEGVITEIEHMVWWGIDKIIDSLNRCFLKFDD